MKTKANIGKRKSIRSLMFVLGMIMSITLIGCEAVLVAIVDCIINIHPNLPDQELVQGYLEEPYYDELKASMINEPNNDNYNYNFNISGQLPEGIIAGAYDRTVFFEGTPMESGRYIIKVDLDVEPYDQETTLCNDSASKEYVLIIANK